MTVALARPARACEPRDCFHCGLPVPAGSTFGFEAREGWRAFCCAGCHAISHAISQRGLDDYYRLRDSVAQRATSEPDARDLTLFDDELVQARFVRHERGMFEADLVVEGVRCAACTWLIEETLRRVDGVAEVQAQYASRRVRVRWRPGAVRLSAIFAAIGDIGYEAWPYEERRVAVLEAREQRSMLLRLLVAALGMMQVMMYAVPAYLAGDGEITADIESLMRWSSLVLTIPVIGYSAGPFFTGAWRDLRLRRLGMDVPVALGLAVAFLASVAAVVARSGPVYFDSIAMFVFLLLGGRYLELRARTSAARGLRALARLVPQLANRIVEGRGLETERVASALLRPGDRLLVRPGETLPADGELAGAQATVSEALLTGESVPRTRRRGESLTGGSINAGSAFILRVTAVGDDTVLARIHRMVGGALLQRPRWTDAAEKAVAIFVAFTLVASLLAAIAWSFVDPSRALWVAVSVLIVTCPCALSLATPMALTVATGRMARANVVIARASAIETLAGVTDIVFDKTGTLTAGKPALRDVVPLGAVDRGACLAIAAALARLSAHPLDRALVEAAVPFDLPDLSDGSSISGHGIEARLSGRRVRLGRADFVAGLHRLPTPAVALAEGDTIAWLGDEAGWIAAFTFADRLRDEAAAAVTRLKARDMTVHLLTGDEPSAAGRAAAAVGIERVEARATPERKVGYVAALQLAGARVAMVGDGMNDAPVLARADLSIAMGSAADIAQTQADAVLLGDSLDDLVEAFSAARRTRAVIRQNLSWALAYNAIAIPLAFAGLVTPVIAGIGMASSSLVVVANALRLGWTSSTSSSR